MQYEFGKKARYIVLKKNEYWPSSILKKKLSRKTNLLPISEIWLMIRWEKVIDNVHRIVNKMEIKMAVDWRIYKKGVKFIFRWKCQESKNDFIRSPNRSMSCKNASWPYFEVIISNSASTLAFLRWLYSSICSFGYIRVSVLAPTSDYYINNFFKTGLENFYLTQGISPLLFSMLLHEMATSFPHPSNPYLIQK